MARAHQKLGTAGAFGHDAQPEVGHQVRQRNAGGTLHRRGEKKGAKQAPPTVAKAVVVHLEKQEFALEAKIVAGLARANAIIKANRAAEADRKLWVLQNIRYLPPVEEKAKHIAMLFATYKG